MATCFAKSLTPRQMAAFWAKVCTSHTGCWEWTAAKYAKGYGAFRAFGRTTHAHRVSYELAYGSIPDGLFILHKCDNPGCVNPSHLYAGTPAQNTADMVNRGRVWRGEDYEHAKLRECDVRDIRQRYNMGEKQLELAIRFGVGQDQISRIVNYKRWSHIA